MPPTILIVDDEVDCLRILEHAVAAAGYRCIPAYGGADALRKVKRHKPDLVLTDLAMPQVSGVELIHAIKHDAETCHIPVLAVTAYIWDTIARAAGNAGCDGYIAKPFRMRDLVERVRRYFETRATA
jgi:two-component system cell cycle response regulator DivK